VRAALKAGALGYVSKGIDGDELVAAARKLLTGARYISSDLAARIIAGGDEKPAPPRVTPTHLPPLTARETEILEHLGEGLSNQEIAERIGLTENTVKHYLTPLLQKLGVRNRTEAALLMRKSASLAGE
jgi:DNA-binding NarL/FixJ family response regulator